jgi:hypothetical protein
LEEIKRDVGDIPGKERDSTTKVGKMTYWKRCFNLEEGKSLKS